MFLQLLNLHHCTGCWCSVSNILRGEKCAPFPWCVKTVHSQLENTCHLAQHGFLAVSLEGNPRNSCYKYYHSSIKFSGSKLTELDWDYGTWYFIIFMKFREAKQKLRILPEKQEKTFFKCFKKIICWSL